MIAEDEASKISVDSYQDPILRICDAQGLFVPRIGTEITALDNVAAFFLQPCSK